MHAHAFALMRACVLELIHTWDPAGKRVRLAAYDDDAAAAAAGGGGGGANDSNPLAGDVDAGSEGAPTGAATQERRFRGQRVETPSHPGG